MSLSNGGTIQYSDLINGVYEKLLGYSSNIGTSYKAGVPDQLKYPYSFSQPITVTSGLRPSVVWTNSSKIALVEESVFKSQFDAFCNTYLLTVNSKRNTPITLGEAIEFLTAVVCFIQCKFSVVYSHLTDKTAIYFLPSNEINYSLITTMKPFNITTGSVDALLNDVCSSAVSSLKTFSAIENYTIRQ